MYFRRKLSDNMVLTILEWDDRSGFAVLGFKFCVLRGKSWCLLTGVIKLMSVSTLILEISNLTLNT